MNIIKKIISLGILLFPTFAFAQVCNTPNPTETEMIQIIQICLPSTNANTISALALRQVLESMTSALFKGTGTVSSVGLGLPNIFTVTGSPVTSTGTLTGLLVSQSKNLVFASPNGLSGTPTFRSLVSADFGNIIPPIPSNSVGDIVSGAKFWWGLRAYDTAAKGTRAANICLSTDGMTDLACVDVLTDVTTGNLITPVIVNAVTCGTTPNVDQCTIKTWYDQSGALACTGSVACDLTQSTVALRPSYVPACNQDQTQPCVDFNSEALQVLNTTINAFNQAQPVTVSAIALQRALRGTFLNNPNLHLTYWYFQGSQLKGNDAFGVFITPYQWYASEWVISNSIGKVYLSTTQGSFTANATVSDNPITSSRKLNVGDDGFGTYFNGQVEEIGGWSIAFNSTQAANILANQQGFFRIPTTNPLGASAFQVPPLQVDITAPPFNARCDGIHDDTDAINAAFLTASGGNTFGEGSTVIFPSTGCATTSTINVGPFDSKGLGNYISIHGVGSPGSLPGAGIVYKGDCTGTAVRISRNTSFTVDHFAVTNQCVPTDKTTITASITGTTLTVTAVSANTLASGQRITGTGIPPVGIFIDSQLTGSTGSTGTYKLNFAPPRGDVSSEAMTAQSFGTGILQGGDGAGFGTAVNAAVFNTITVVGFQYGIVAGHDGTAASEILYQNVNFVGNDVGFTQPDFNSLDMTFIQPLMTANGVGLSTGASENFHVLGGSATNNYITDFRVEQNGNLDLYGWRSEGANQVVLQEGGALFMSQCRCNAGTDSFRRPDFGMITGKFHSLHIVSSQLQGRIIVDGAIAYNIIIETTSVWPDALTNLPFSVNSNAGAAGSDHAFVRNNINALAFTNLPTFTASGSGTTLTVTGISGGQIFPGELLTGDACVPANTTIIQQVGTFTGLNGTYTTSNATTCSGASLTTAVALSVLDYDGAFVNAGAGGISVPGNIMFDPFQYVYRAPKDSGGTADQFGTDWQALYHTRCIGEGSISSADSGSATMTPCVNMRVSGVFPTSNTSLVTFKHTVTANTGGGQSCTLTVSSGTAYRSDAGKPVLVVGQGNSGHTDFIGYVLKYVDSTHVKVQPAFGEVCPNFTNSSVVFGADEPDANYIVVSMVCSAGETFNVDFTTFATTGFTAKSSNATSTATCNFMLVR